MLDFNKSFKNNRKSHSDIYENFRRDKGGEYIFDIDK